MFPVCLTNHCRHARKFFHPTTQLSADTINSKLHLCWEGPQCSKHNMP